MIEAGWGRIVNISSSSTHSGGAVHGALRGRQVRRQRADQGAGAWSTARAASPSTRCRPASSTRRCCARPRVAGSSATSRRPSTRRRCGRIGRPEDIAAACAFLGLRGGRLHHRADPRRQRRPQHLTPTTAYEGHLSGTRLGQGRIRHWCRTRAGPQSCGSARRGRRRHHRRRPVSGHRRRSATRWRHRRIWKRPLSSSRRPASACFTAQADVREACQLREALEEGSEGVRQGRHRRRPGGRRGHERRTAAAGVDRRHQHQSGRHPQRHPVSPCRTFKEGASIVADRSTLP